MGGVKGGSRYEPEKTYGRGSQTTEYRETVLTNRGWVELIHRPGLNSVDVRYR